MAVESRTFWIQKLWRNKSVRSSRFVPFFSLGRTYLYGNILVFSSRFVTLFSVGRASLYLNILVQSRDSVMWNLCYFSEIRVLNILRIDQFSKVDQCINVFRSIIEKACSKIHFQKLNLSITAEQWLCTLTHVTVATYRSID